MKTVSFALLLACVLIRTAIAEFKLPDTGQDGYYSINPMSYTDNGDETVIDNNTGLRWQKQDDGITYTSDQTVGVCQSLTLGNRSDWRVPTKKELLSIVDFSIPSPGPLIKGSYFPNTKSAFYSSSTYSYGLQWMVDFSTGQDRESDGSDELYVRCVSGGVLSQSLVDNGNGVVTDAESQLMWQQGEGGAMNWGSALAYCEGLSLGRHSDWRLPNVRELAFLVDDTRDTPTLNKSYFPAVFSDRYWSSTTANEGIGWARSVDFTWGGVRGSGKGSDYHVRCVRGGESGTLVNLTVSRHGRGSGNVGADKGVLSWEGATGTADYPFGDHISLTLNPDDTSLFGGWSGGGCSGTGSCMANMIGDVSVSALFNLKPVRIAGAAPLYFATLQAAHDNALTGNTVEAMGTEFPEIITVNRDITLRGGYDDSYSDSGGITSIRGLIIAGGSLTAGNLVIKGD